MPEEQIRPYAGDPGEPIAIVGIGCRFPGGANDPDSFWHLLETGTDAVVDVPADRWDVKRFYDPNPEKPGKMSVRRGGFLQAPIDQFDALFFGISPREAMYMDPQQRLLLEVTWEAMEDAGQDWAQLRGSDAGVYMGGFTLDTKISQFGLLNRRFISSHTPISGTMTMLANRISYTFDFRGPSVSLDTACSSSLAAFHYACMGLWNQECSVAFAGGVNIMFRPEYGITLSKGHFLSPDGRCKAFDAAADGYGRGEGAGVVVLKRLSGALADQDHIYALVRGSGINQDGHTASITLPNGEAQAALIRQVCRQADIDPGRLSYIEAHGTGTQAGDTAEAMALGSVLGAGRAEDKPCIVGSVKTNIGHLEAAAGIAGVIKTVLCLYHRTIPPNLHFRTPSPDIPFDAYKLRIPETLMPWPETDQPALAGINSFGYGGTNAHVILEGVAPVKPSYSEAPDHKEVYFVWPLSARSDEALRATGQAYLDFIENRTDGAINLRNLAYSSAIRRTHHDHRLALVGTSLDSMVDRLRSFLAGEAAPGVITGQVQATQTQHLVFVYTGMGPQWYAMGRELLEKEPVYRETVARCDAVFQQHANWSLMDALQADEDERRMLEPEVVQTTNFALQVGLTELWATWGIRPDAVVGHSAGEIASAYVSGALSLEDAVTASYHRGRILQKVKDQGRMLSVGLSAARAQELLTGLESLVSIAGINSRKSVVLSGDPASLEEIARFLEEKHIFNRFLYVNVAYHSYQMEAYREDLLASLQTIKAQKPVLPLYSTATGRRVESAVHDADYWWSNLRAPVRFADAMTAMIEDGRRSFLEVGPHPVLAADIKEALADHEVEGRSFVSLYRKKSDRLSLFETVGELYGHGYPIDWSCFFEGNPGEYVKLPAYPWQRESYFIESDASREDRLGPDSHMLLGDRVRGAGYIRELELNDQFQPYLKDHRIDGEIVFPGAGYVEAGLALDRELFGDRPCDLESVAFHQALVVDPLKVTMMQLHVDAADHTFEIYSSSDDNRTDWTLNATGRLLQSKIGDRPVPVDLDAVRHRCPIQVDIEELYAGLYDRGYHYGSQFRGLQRLRCSADEVVFEVQYPEMTQEEQACYRLHPAILDAGFQAMIAAVEENEAGSALYMPVEIGRVRLYEIPVHPVLGYGRITSHTADVIQGDVTLCDETGAPFARVTDLKCRKLPAAGTRRKAETEPWLYEYGWEKTEQLVAGDAAPVPSGTWLLFEGEQGRRVASALEAAGTRIIRILQGKSWQKIDDAAYRIDAEKADAWRRLIDDIDMQQVQGAIYLWGPSGDPGVSPASCLNVMSFVQALAGRVKRFRLGLVTCLAQRATEADSIPNVQDAGLWGLGRVIMAEHAELGCRLVDMDDSPDNMPGLMAALSDNNREEEIALRQGTTFVRRLMRTDEQKLASASLIQMASGDGAGFRLQVMQPGLLNSLTYEQINRRPPASGEIEIQVHTTPLNFKDVMKVMDMLSDRVLDGTFFGNTLGMECAGTVTAVGEDIQHISAGDEVVVITGTGCFQSYLTIKADEAYIIPKPTSLTMDQAAVFVPYLTVYYALKEVARLEKGERILIHAATGGVGLAAVYYAQAVGADIFATAGSDAKRDYLRSLGIKHVMDSRSLAFADEVMTWTDGRGVDVVLNSLSGDALRKSVDILAPYGRFIEIGKRDIDEDNNLGLRPFNRNLTFSAIDGDRMLVERRASSYRLLKEVAGALESGMLKPLPVHVFPAEDAADAFRFMAQAGHMGKVAVSMHEQDVSARRTVTVAQAVSPEGTYLVTGGLGGFGLETARRLADQGARSLVLVGRSGATSPEAQAAVADLKTAGVEVVVRSMDVSRPDQVSALIDQIRQTMPPLKGIIHAAGVLADVTIDRMDRKAFDKVWAPKAAGAWHLHRATMDLPLDFFIMFSSVSSVLGNAGQGNYAAANAFLDALAACRQTLGLPGLSISWGALTRVGMAARNPEVIKRLEFMGIRGIEPGQALHGMGRLIAQSAGHICVTDMDWRKWKQAHVRGAQSPRYSYLIEANENVEAGVNMLLHRLKSFDNEARFRQLQTMLLEQIARILKMPASKIDVNRSLIEQGMDSLMGAELITDIQITFGIEMSQMDFINGGAVADLTRLLSDRLGYQKNGMPDGAERIAESELRVTVEGT